MPHISDSNKEGRKYEQKDLFVLGSKSRKKILIFLSCMHGFESKSIYWSLIVKTVSVTLHESMSR